MREVGYTGNNAHCFQRAATNAVNKVYDHALQHKQSALLDGTFTYGNWRENIDRSLTKGRLVEIYYLYQDPVVAWDYVEKRRKAQGRAVPKDVFVEDYYKSMENVKAAKQLYGNKITLYFAKNNNNKALEYIKIDVQDIDSYLPQVNNITKLIEALEDV